jgi:hypothetical protein
MRVSKLVGLSDHPSLRLTCRKDAMTDNPVPGTMQDPLFCGAVSAYVEFCKLKTAGGGRAGPRDKANPALPATGFNRFYELAQFCAERGWNPLDYVREVYANSSDKPLKDVVGKDLVSEKARNFYGKRQALGAPNEYVLVWFCAENLLKQVRSSPLYKEIPTTDILANLSLSQFPNWFRLLYPWPPETKLCDLLDMDVLRDIHNDRKLLEALESVCPAQLEELYKRRGVRPNYSKGNESNE